LGYYSIKDLENLTGIKAHTIRVWEQRYRLIQPERTDTNIRLYGDEELKLMLNIALLNNHGYKISKIAQMSRHEVHERVLAAIEQLQDYNDQINALTVSMIDFNEEQFETIISRNISDLGFEKCMIHVIFPFLIKVGLLWATNAINPAQEHFITNLIRQKIIVAIDEQYVIPNKNKPRFMLFLPEGELHEISLLFSHYLLKTRAFKVIYLGQWLPLIDLEMVYQVYKPQYMFSIITSVPGSEDIQHYLNALGSRFKDSQIILTGMQVLNNTGLNFPPNIVKMSSISSMTAFLDSL
jgi:MerR family transcriptional regulator, light-induced transcriptional regulator